MSRLRFVMLGARNGGPGRWEGSMTVALVVAGPTGPGLLTVAAGARTAWERVLICIGTDTVPEPVLARLLDVGGTAAFTGVTPKTPRTPKTPPQPRTVSAALVVDPP